MTEKKKICDKNKYFNSYSQETNNLHVVKTIDENTENNIIDNIVISPSYDNLITTFSTASKLSRRLNFQSDSKVNYKKQRIEFDYKHKTNFKSSFTDLVNFDLNEESVSYNILNTKNISTTPYKVLDAPLLKDDFYLHLLDWSKFDVLSVGLENSVYLWESKTSKVVLLKSYNEDKVTSVSWLPDGQNLLVGLNSGTIHIWNIYKNICVQTYNEHTDRVGVFAPINNNNFVFSSGSLDHTINNFDIRSKEIALKMVGHRQEVCGLKWSYDGKLLASGGNDNKLMVWTLQKSIPIQKFNSHISAVKAVEWSNQKLGLLASGGGTQDRTIKFWNTNTMKMIESIDTCSQVCNIAFSKITNEFVTTHGYSDNLILVWDFEKLEVIATLKGHRDRVNFLATSPDGSKIVTGAGDETIRFWEVFKKDEDDNNQNLSKLSKFKIR
jgi:cell division cycle 20-like protein 1 (cofactor of APC complex)